MTTFLSNRDIYTSVVCSLVPQAKERKRNFENGVLTDDPALVEPLVEQFDSVWRGAFCRDCGRSALGFASAIPSRCSALTSFGGYATSAATRWCRLSG